MEATSHCLPAPRHRSRMTAVIPPKEAEIVVVAKIRAAVAVAAPSMAERLAGVVSEAQTHATAASAVDPSHARRVSWQSAEDPGAAATKDTAATSSRAPPLYAAALVANPSDAAVRVATAVIATTL